MAPHTAEPARNPPPADRGPVEIDDLLRERFGFASFRAGQREAIKALLGGRDLLCIQPTGHGKSLIYQLTAVALGGLTVVVSPLLALMRDQLGHLERRFHIAAASINSDQEEGANDAAIARANTGALRLLFLSPEQLDRVDRAEWLLTLDIRLLVIDEAHCVSTWGHDFRPAYREIGRLVARLRARGAVRVLALTATADARTETDICAQLAPLQVQRRDMDRPNLALAVRRVDGMAAKLAVLEDFLRREPGCCLLYCATRDNTELVAEYLTGRGIPVAAYHAGMSPDRKRALQGAFIAGGQRVIAATNALGMGIDKADLRAVVHVDVPGSITAYYQEVGRAGRDGLPARGLLLYDREDRRIQEYFIHSAQPTPQDFALILRALGDGPLRLNAIKRATGLHPTRVTVVVAELIEQGFLVKQRRDRGQVYARTDLRRDPELTRYRNQQIVRTGGLERMLAYAEGRTGCLMRTLRVELGDPHAADCGRCGPCTRASGHAADPAVAHPALAGGADGSDKGAGVDDGPGLATTDRPADDLSGIRAWLHDRPVVVPGYRKLLLPGRALFDSQRRSRGFLRFMRARRRAPPDPAVLARARDLTAAMGDFVAVLPLPSATWQGRAVAAAALGLPVLDILAWRDPPEARQGTLRNNDQRRDNVRDRMMLTGAPPTGDVLLLDDYTGSGATLRAAARALADAGHDGRRVPFAFARVRWRLGRPGIV